MAGIAAGSGDGYAGAAPASKIVSIDQGMAMTRDVIAAADWVLQNKDKYGIRVVNFSLHSSQVNSFMYDPLDKAVERLWLSGVVVVAAAGNCGVEGKPSGVPFAPGNDPFVITVGADDIDGSVSMNDDYTAPWSADGYTLDGFAKPDIAAPGRYMVGPVPATSTLVAEKPASVVAPGYIQLSGTSFAAPVVAGAAAQILSAHPTWKPDQVKGALMVTARPAGGSAPLSAGVGVVDIAKAVALSSAPNLNAALNSFVKTDVSGGYAFDAASRASTPPPTRPGRAPHGRMPPGPPRRGTRPAGRPPPGPRLPGRATRSRPPRGPARHGHRPPGRTTPRARRRPRRPST